MVVESLNAPNIYLIHYKGWTNKQDEFIQVGSNRLAPLGRFTLRNDIPKYAKSRNKTEKPIVNLPNKKDSVELEVTSSDEGEGALGSMHPPLLEEYEEEEKKENKISPEQEFQDEEERKHEQLQKRLSHNVEIESEEPEAEGRLEGHGRHGELEEEEEKEEEEDEGRVELSRRRRRRHGEEEYEDAEEDDEEESSEEEDACRDFYEEILRGRDPASSHQALSHAALGHALPGGAHLDLQLMPDHHHRVRTRHHRGNVNIIQRLLNQMGSYIEQTH